MMELAIDLALRAGRARVAGAAAAAAPWCLAVLRETLPDCFEGEICT